MPKVIAEFQGEYRFLSNFWPMEDGFTLEHYFQAAKANNKTDWAWVMASPNPGEAKRRGRRITLRSDWESVKDEQMSYLVYMKFQKSPLREMLLGTEDAVLIEGNRWGDKYWGVDLETGEGLNRLGQTLMDVRELLRLRDAQNLAQEAASDEAAVGSDTD